MRDGMIEKTNRWSGFRSARTQWSVLRCPRLERAGLALYVAKLAEGIAERRTRCGRAGMEPADSIRLPAECPVTASDLVSVWSPTDRNACRSMCLPNVAPRDRVARAAAPTPRPGGLAKDAASIA